MEATLSKEILTFLQSHLPESETGRLYIDLTTGKVSDKPAALGPTPEDMNIAKQACAKVIADLEPHIKSIIFFGSRARGEGRRNSDYDLLVIQSKSSLMEVYDLEGEALSKLFGFMEEMDVTIHLEAITQDTKSSLLESIKSGGIYLYGTS